MNYSNYNDAIVQGRKVKIIGWPADVAFNSPSTIGNLKDMCTLHDGWMAGSIRWVRMSTADVKEHADDLERHRAEGQTIGKKRKRRTTKQKAKQNAPTDSDDKSSVHRDKENDAPSKPTAVTK